MRCFEGGKNIRSSICSFCSCVYFPQEGKYCSQFLRRINFCQHWEETLACLLAVVTIPPALWTHFINFIDIQQSSQISFSITSVRNRLQTSIIHHLHEVLCSEISPLLAVASPFLARLKQGKHQARGWTPKPWKYYLPPSKLRVKSEEWSSPCSLQRKGLHEGCFTRFLQFGCLWDRELEVPPECSSTSMLRERLHHHRPGPYSWGRQSSQMFLGRGGSIGMRCCPLFLAEQGQHISFFLVVLEGL